MTQYFGSSHVSRFDNLKARVLEGNGGINISSLEINTSYLNGCKCPVTVVLRSGLALTISPTVNRVVKDFVVKVTYRFGNDVNIDVRKVLHDVNKDSPKELQVLKEAVDNCGERGFHGKRTFSVEYSFSESDIGAHGGSIYVPHLDVLMSTLTHHYVPAHPYSCEGVKHRLITTNETVNNVGVFGYSVKIVDNGGVFGNRFININGQCFKVPVIKNLEMKDGIYVTSSGPVEGDYDNCPPRCVRYGFDDTDISVALYRTLEEAKTLGDTLATRQREIEEQALEVKREENRLKLEHLQRGETIKIRLHEIETDRMELDVQRKRHEASIESSLADIKKQREELEHIRQMQLLEAKSKYEHRSLARKDTSEVVKFLPAILTGGIALLAIAWKSL